MGTFNLTPTPEMLGGSFGANFGSYLGSVSPFLGPAAFVAPWIYNTIVGKPSFDPNYIMPGMEEFLQNSPYNTYDPNTGIGYEDPSGMTYEQLNGLEPDVYDVGYKIPVDVTAPMPTEPIVVPPPPVIPPQPTAPINFPSPEVPPPPLTPESPVFKVDVNETLPTEPNVYDLPPMPSPQVFNPPVDYLPQGPVFSTTVPWNPPVDPVMPIPTPAPTPTPPAQKPIDPVLPTPTPYTPPTTPPPTGGITPGTGNTPSLPDIAGSLGQLMMAASGGSAPYPGEHAPVVGQRSTLQSKFPLQQARGLMLPDLAQLWRGR